MTFVYILKSVISSSYYVGSCKDIERRINLHNSGLVKSTKRYIPWNIVYSEIFSDLKSARHRELQIKSWKSRKAIERLISHRKI